MSDITRQKTIDYLYYLKTHYPKNLIIPEYIDFAISSLETDEAYQLEYEQPEFCKNCIDREAVYYYISSHIHEIITESGTDKNAHTNAILRSLANGVKTMPSVLPKVTKNDLGVDVPDNNVGNIDCISRAQAQTKIEMNASRYTIARERGGMGQVEWSDQLIKVSDAVNIIRELPSVMPKEPIHGKCNQCKYYGGVHDVQGHAPCSYHKIGGVLWNWYCSQFESEDKK